MDNPLNTPSQTQIEKMIAGEQKALEEILCYYEKPLFNHLFRLTKDMDEASLLLQDTFVKMYTKRSQIDPQVSIKNWLYKIATNTAYDYFRKKKREGAISFEDDELSETIETETSYSTIEQEIQAYDLEKALGKIQARYRTILLLYYKEKFSYEEISEILDIPINTTKTHLRRARKELETLLKNTYG